LPDPAAPSTTTTPPRPARACSLAAPQGGELTVAFEERQLTGASSASSNIR
jgi:hypothetical protein